MEKEINLLDGNTISINISNGYAGTGIRITKRYFENGEYIKEFVLAMWDDYGFDAWIDDIDTYLASENVSFSIPFYDPMYYCFYNFLKDKKEIIIDTDDESELNKKTLTIRKNEDNTIELLFENKLVNQKKCERFVVFIKNIGFDLRSKIDCFNLDTKERLYIFFNEAVNALLEEYHQITIDEYLLTRSLTKE